MIFKRKFSTHNATIIFSDFAILYGLFSYIDVFKMLPSKDTKIVLALALIFMAWLFIKELIFFRIKLKESDLDDEEKQKGFIIFIIYILLIISITVIHIAVGFKQ